MNTISNGDQVILRGLRELSARLKVSEVLVEHLEQYFADADVAAFGDASLEDLHGAAIFLASRASDFVNGQVLFVDGGMVAVV